MPTIEEQVRARFGPPEVLKSGKRQWANIPPTLAPPPSEKVVIIKQDNGLVTIEIKD